MSIASDNAVRALEERVQKLEQRTETQLEERVAKLEGELKALKARMGKKPPE